MEWCRIDFCLRLTSNFPISQIIPCTANFRKKWFIVVRYSVRCGRIESYWYLFVLFSTASKEFARKFSRTWRKSIRENERLNKRGRRIVERWKNTGIVVSPSVTRLNCAPERSRIDIRSDVRCNEVFYYRDWDTRVCSLWRQTVGEKRRWIPVRDVFPCNRVGRGTENIRKTESLEEKWILSS